MYDEYSANMEQQTKYQIEIEWMEMKVNAHFGKYSAEFPSNFQN